MLYQSLEEEICGSLLNRGMQKRILVVKLEFELNIISFIIREVFLSFKKNGKAEEEDAVGRA